MVFHDYAPEFITPEDLGLIDRTLRKRQQPDGRHIGVVFIDDYVSVHGIFGRHSPNVSLRLVSPIEAAERQVHIGRWRVYTEPFNPDWSVVIVTTFRR